MARKRLLIVEDDPKSRYALQSVLEDQGHEVSVFSSAEDAAKLDGHAVDVAIIDVRLPQQSGVDFAREFRRRHEGTKIIFITAYDDLKNQPPLQGCVLLVKPIDVEALFKLI